MIPAWRGLATILLLAAGCRASEPSVDRARAASSEPGAPSTSATPAATHLQVRGPTFRTPDGSAFQWRGITAFRLLDYIADRNEPAVEQYLAWAASQKLTVVRVLAMGGGFMDLRPGDGRAALSRLLILARKHGLYVEVVALAGTLEMPVNLEEQVTAIGEILGEHPNGLLEIANEPAHPSQAPAVGKPGVLLTLASRVPTDVPVALGSIEADPGFARGDYVTWHVPRDNKLDGWGHVLSVAPGAEFVQKFGKPVISDEPIGAGAKYIAGRRDDSPARLRAGALLTRLAGMGATFHYEGGLEAKIPEGRELECFNAWNQAWTLLPGDVETQGAFAVSGGDSSIVRNYDREAALGVFERVAGDKAWLLSLGPRDPAVKLDKGWQVTGAQDLEGARLITAVRSK